MAPLAKLVVGLMMILLLGDHIMLGRVSAGPICRCNTKSYAPDGVYARHVFYVKYDLWATTPKYKNDGYDYYNSSPGGDEREYGHPRCSTDLGPDDCRGCIGARLGVMNDRCGPSVGAEAVLDNCQLRYEAYPIDG